jgi:hypothetical protein
MSTVLRVVNWFQTWGFRILGVFVRGVTAALTRIMRRGRFRSWRKEA